MEYSYKFRIYPNSAQQNLIQRTFGCCRFVFNRFLSERMEAYKNTGSAPTRFQQDKSLTTLKGEKDWLREVDSTSLQASLQALDIAYQNFFRRVKRGESPVILVSNASMTIGKVIKASALEQTSRFMRKRYSCPSSAW